MIYKTFEEWKAGHWLEDGEPRTEAYTEDELLLVEMGWKYGFDAGKQQTKPTITKVDGKVVALTMTDDEHRIHEVLWQSPRELSDGCGNCHACLVGVMENNMLVTSQRMIVCSDCGNKRCPKASNHRHKCTGSNEVGQYGSIYTAPRELSDEELNKAFDYYCETDEGVLRFNYELRDEWKKEQLSRWKESFKKAREK